MKKTILALVLPLLSAAALASGGSEDLMRQTVDAAFKDVQDAIAASPVPAGATVAVLPVAGDRDRYIAGRLKNAVTAGGRKCVEDKDDPVFGEILKEIAWDERKEDILDPATVQKFGRLQAAQVLLTATVRTLESNERYSFFEFELHATEIATKRHLWGDVFEKHLYMPGLEDAAGESGIPAPLRDALASEMRAKIEASLKKSGKLSNIGKVAYLPLAGDSKGYVFSIVRDAVSSTSMSLVNLDVATRGEARMRLRDRRVAADALLSGSVRELSGSVVEDSPAGKRFRYRAEVQLCIEGTDGAALWSDTISIDVEREEELGIWGRLCKLFPSLASKPWLAVVVPVCLVLGVFVFISVLRGMTRVR